MMEGRYRYVVAALLFAAGIINYMDRAALGVAAPLLRRDLHLSPSELGLIFSTFFVGYALFNFLGGQLADRFGPRRVYSWAASGWSLFCALTGAVSGFVSLFAVRVLFGAAEGPMNATTNRAITDWFARDETARAIGIIFSGQTIGSAIAAPLVGLLALSYGWRVAFFAIGAAGLVWVLVWRRCFTDRPAENRRVAPAELEHLARGQAGRLEAHTGETLPLRHYLLRASTLSLALGMFAGNYILYIFLSWLPSYLVGALHMDIRRMAFVAAIPWLCGFVGYNAGGFISDMLYRRLRDRVLARKLATTLPLACSAAALLAVPHAHGAVQAVTLIALAVMWTTGSIQSCWASIHELVPTARIGATSGFIHLLSNISGVVGPAATGFAVQYLGGYDSAFFVSAGVAVAGVVAMALFVRRPREMPAAVPHGAGQRPV